MGFLDDPATQRADRRYVRVSMQAPSPDDEFSLARRWRAERDAAALMQGPPEEPVIEMRDGAARIALAESGLDRVHPRERRIIQQRCLLTEESATLGELGEEFGVSKERARQLEHRALLKLKTGIERRVETAANLLLPR